MLGQRIFQIGAALEGLGCLWFDPQALSASHTNHDPEDLLESIEVFRTRGVTIQRTR